MDGPFPILGVGASAGGVEGLEGLFRNMPPDLGIAFIIILVDQFTKTLILGDFQLGDSRTVTWFFNVVRAHNTGAAFNFLATATGWQRWFFVGLGLAATVFIVWMLKRHGGQRLFSLALAFILGGALGNVIDRLMNLTCAGSGSVTVIGSVEPEPP